MSDVSTKEHPGPFDGMEKAAPDEPVFTLVGHDESAWELVLEWVKRRRKKIGKMDLKPAKRELELKQCREAEEIGWAMKRWYETGTTEEEKLSPTDDAAQSKGYSGNQYTEEELRAKELFDARKGMVRVLNNALSELIDASKRLAPFGFATQRKRADKLVEEMRSVSDTVDPKRIGYSTADLDKDYD